MVPRSVSQVTRKSKEEKEKGEGSCGSHTPSMREHCVAGHVPFVQTKTSIPTQVIKGSSDPLHKVGSSISAQGL